MPNEAKEPNQVIIHEMDEEGMEHRRDGDAETLYSLHLKGDAEEYDFSDESDYLSAEDAHEIAQDVADETGAQIVWEGTKPSWA